MHFFQELHARNPILARFGWACWAAGLVCGLLIFTTDLQVLGVSAWLKPFKFFVSTAIFVWTMGWLGAYLRDEPAVRHYSWLVLWLFVLEDVYIAWRAGLGLLSHFDQSSWFGAAMFAIMGAAALGISILTARLGWRFWRGEFPELPRAYLWAIRLAMLGFVVFSVEGMMMGSRLAHTVGAPDGGAGLPLVNWSRSHGDLRIAHFLGMHALQVLPILGFYVFKRPAWMIAVGLGYLALVTAVLVQALAGMPLV